MGQHITDIFMYLRGLEYNDEPMYDFIKYKLAKIAKEANLCGMSQ